jgi:hypothetical protein
VIGVIQFDRIFGSVAEVALNIVEVDRIGIELIASPWDSTFSGLGILSPTSMRAMTGNQLAAMPRLSEEERRSGL